MTDILTSKESLACIDPTAGCNINNPKSVIEQVNPNKAYMTTSDIQQKIGILSDQCYRNDNKYTPPYASSSRYKYISCCDPKNTNQMDYDTVPIKVVKDPNNPNKIKEIHACNCSGDNRAECIQQNCPASAGYTMRPSQYEYCKASSANSNAISGYGGSIFTQTGTDPVEIKYESQLARDCYLDLCPDAPKEPTNAVKPAIDINDPNVIAIISFIVFIILCICCVLSIFVYMMNRPTGGFRRPISGTSTNMEDILSAVRTASEALSSVSSAKGE